MAQPDHYKTLGVAEGASAEEIKKSYRKLAKRYHPDATGGDKAKESKFKEITEAYEVLSDEQKRKEYDEVRKNPFASGMPGGGFPGGGFPGGFPGGRSRVRTGGSAWRRSTGSLSQLPYAGRPEWPSSSGRQRGATIRSFRPGESESSPGRLRSRSIQPRQPSSDLG